MPSVTVNGVRFGFGRMIFFGGLAACIMIYNAVDRFNHRPTPEKAANFQAFKADMQADCTKDDRVSAEICSCVIKNAENFTPLPRDQHIEKRVENGMSMFDLTAITEEQLADAYYRNKFGSFMAKLGNMEAENDAMDKVFLELQKNLRVKTAKIVGKGCFSRDQMKSDTLILKTQILHSKAQRAASFTNQLALYRIENGYTDNQVRVANRANEPKKEASLPNLRR